MMAPNHCYSQVMFSVSICLAIEMIFVVALLAFEEAVAISLHLAAFESALAEASS